MKKPVRTRFHSQHLIHQIIDGEFDTADGLLRAKFLRAITRQQLLLDRASDRLMKTSHHTSYET